MANNAYPVVNTQPTDIKSLSDGRVSVRATNGALKTRLLFTADKASFELEHWVNTSDRSTLWTFYNNNKLLDIDYTDPTDNAVRVVRYAGPYQERWQSPGRWIMRVKLEEV